MRILVLAPALLILFAELDAERVAGQSPIPIKLTSAAAVGEQTSPDSPAHNGAAWYSRVLSALAGGALGAGAGFFASHVFTGDWDERPGENRIDRPAWAAVGGSIGFAVGFSFPIPGRSQSAPPAPVRPSRRFVILADELIGKGINNAFEAVRTLRPEWLNERGSHIIGDRPEDKIEVYLDEVRLGGVETMKDVATPTIRSIHFLDAAAATYRFGAGHSYGVILIIAAGGGSGGPTTSVPR